MSTDLNWCKNFHNNIYIQSESLIVDLNTHSLISVIVGNSSTGKTFMTSVLKDIKDAGVKKLIKSNVNLDDILLCTNKDSIQAMLLNKQNIKGKLIFIDRYDIYYSDELDTFISDSPNKFIIMSHTKYDRLNLNSSSFLVLNYSNTTKKFTTEPAVEGLNFHEQLGY